MRLMSGYRIALGACAVMAGSAWGQPNIPQIVQLPADDFVWPWGQMRPIDDLEQPEFSFSGVELSFRCTAKGSFKPGSHMRDEYNAREFEQALTGSIHFIQDTTAALNELYLSNDLQWALLECVIPETIEPEDAIQERVDRAVERAERERERRREREAESGK
jgi:hypothetical protein